MRQIQEEGENRPEIFYRMQKIAISSHSTGILCLHNSSQIFPGSGYNNYLAKHLPHTVKRILRHCRMRLLFTSPSAGKQNTIKARVSNKSEYLHEFKKIDGVFDSVEILMLYPKASCIK